MSANPNRKSPTKRDAKRALKIALARGVARAMINRMRRYTRWCDPQTGIPHVWTLADTKRATDGHGIANVIEVQW